MHMLYQYQCVCIKRMGRKEEQLVAYWPLLHMIIKVKLLKGPSHKIPDPLFLT